MAMTRREFMISSFLGGTGAVVAMSSPPFPFQSPLLPEFPSWTPQEPFISSFSHNVFAGKDDLEWRVDGFDELAEKIRIEERLLTEFDSGDAILIDREMDEIVDAIRLPERVARQYAPERRRAATDVHATREWRSLLRAKGSRLQLRIGYADVFTEGLERITPWAPYLQKIARAHGLDEELPIALALQETNWSPRLGSSKACHGVFQLNKQNAESYGLHVSRRLNEGFQPLSQARTAMAFFRSRLLLAGNVPLAFSYYHAGENNALKMLAAGYFHGGAKTDREAFVWAIRNYDHPVNTGGFSNYGRYSAHYPLRLHAIKNVIALSEAMPIEAACVVSSGLYAPEVCQVYFGRTRADRASFMELNPHLQTAGGQVLPVTIPRGVDIYLPLEQGEKFLARHGGHLIRFVEGNVHDLPGPEPWTDVDTAYAKIAARRAERLDGVDNQSIALLRAQASALGKGTLFRQQQLATLNKDAALFCEEGRRLYDAVRAGQALPPTALQLKNASQRRG